MSFLDDAFHLACAGLIAVGIAGCSGGDATNEELGQDSPPLPGDTAVLTTTEPAQLDDSRIAAVLAAADSAEIEPSRVAQDNAQNAAVIQFAEMMIRDHGMLSDSLRAITRANGIAPRPNRESDLLRTQTRATVESLRNQTGLAFDSAYVAAMVQSHEAALNLIDSQLIPGAESAQLRRAIELQVRPRIAAHLEQVQQIQTTIDTP